MGVEQAARADGIYGLATRKAFYPLHRQWTAAQLKALAPDHLTKVSIRIQ
jgi:hypothetical protein